MSSSQGWARIKTTTTKRLGESTYVGERANPKSHQLRDCVKSRNATGRAASVWLLRRHVVKFSRKKRKQNGLRKEKVETNEVVLPYLFSEEAVGN